MGAQTDAVELARDIALLNRVADLRGGAVEARRTATRLDDLGLADSAATCRALSDVLQRQAIALMTPTPTGDDS